MGGETLLPYVVSTTLVINEHPWYGSNDLNTNRNWHNYLNEHIWNKFASQDEIQQSCCSVKVSRNMVCQSATNSSLNNPNLTSNLDEPCNNNNRLIISWFDGIEYIFDKTIQIANTKNFSCYGECTIDNIYNDDYSLAIGSLHSEASNTENNLKPIFYAFKRSNFLTCHPNNFRTNSLFVGDYLARCAASIQSSYPSGPDLCDIANLYNYTSGGCNLNSSDACTNPNHNGIQFPSFWFRNECSPVGGMCFRTLGADNAWMTKNSRRILPSVIFFFTIADLVSTSPQGSSQNPTVKLTISNSKSSQTDPPADVVKVLTPAAAIEAVKQLGRMYGTGRDDLSKFADMWYRASHDLNFPVKFTASPT